MIEAIIGRQHGTNCLLMVIGGQGYALSGNGTVPKTVSSSHCKLTVDDNGTWKLSNIKAELDTFVDGLQIDTKRVSPSSRVELGANHFVLNMHKVESVIRQLQPAVFSLRPLEQIWKNYDDEKLQMQNKEMKIANFQRLQGALSMSAMLFGFIPQLGVFRWVIMGLALLIAIFFFVRGSMVSNSLPMKLKKLNDKFEAEYLCPNPQCPRFLGYRPYNQLQYDRGCPLCQCRYTNT
ncbi:MAG: FHA domain-containing protein [Bacteroidaceae bacterium]|nr:FHA domain-containing protein [Bacteroidaceae bacterium]